MTEKDSSDSPNVAEMASLIMQLTGQVQGLQRDRDAMHIRLQAIEAWIGHRVIREGVDNDSEQGV